MSQYKIISIAGPTACGKTQLAIDLALRWNAEIISFDSRQVFKELQIGVARPNAKELAMVKHHLIAYKSIHENYSAQCFIQDAAAIVHNPEASSKNFILVGGTGFYLKALLHGLDALPNISAETRRKVAEEMTEQGLGYVQKRVEAIDPESYHNMDIQNPRRLQRILEIWEETGEKYSDLVTRNDPSDLKDETQVPTTSAGMAHRVKNIVLDIPRELLYDRINQRVEQMMDNGLLQEVQDLFPYKNLNSLQTVGYKELFDYLENKLPLNYAIEKIKQHTRNYAKRQITWNKKYLPNALWLNPQEDLVLNNILDYVYS